jgi:hypothetical protein
VFDLSQRPPRAALLEKRGALSQSGGLLRSVPAFAAPLLLATTAAAYDGGGPDFAKLKGDPKMPAGLACLSKYYAGHPVEADGGWFFELESGERIPWHRTVPRAGRDGGVRDAGPDPADGGEEEDENENESLPADPDLSEVFAVPYVKGPIRPVVGDEADIQEPGRARIEELFMGTYGHTASQVRDHLDHVRFFGTRWGFHERAAPALLRVIDRLTPQTKQNPKLLKYLTDIGGTFKWRRIARSTNLSTHAWGIAIDLNVARGYYWRWQRPKKPLKWRNVVPQEIVDAFEAEGFIWGGRWLHYDTMHFEYRPELLDPACRE